MFDRPRIIPCLLIEDKRLVKTKKFRHPDYLGDPVNAVRIYNEKEVDELCILDISRKNREIDFNFLEDIATEAFVPLSYGGGITDINQAKRLYRIGFEKLVFNTSLVKHPELIKEVSSYAGAQSVIASIDVKKTLLSDKICFINCGRKRIKVNPITMAQRAEELGVGEILLNSIDRDGMMKGYDLELIRDISASINIPVIACGGAGSLEDLKLAMEAGAHAVAAGSIFTYYGAKKAVLINYPSEKELIRIGLFKDRMKN